MRTETICVCMDLLRREKDGLRAELHLMADALDEIEGREGIGPVSEARMDGLHSRREELTRELARVMGALGDFQDAEWHIHSKTDGRR